MVTLYRHNRWVSSSQYTICHPRFWPIKSWLTPDFFRTRCIETQLLHLTWFWIIYRLLSFMKERGFVTHLNKPAKLNWLVWCDCFYILWELVIQKCVSEKLSLLPTVCKFIVSRNQIIYFFKKWKLWSKSFSGSHGHDLEGNRFGTMQKNIYAFMLGVHLLIFTHCR